MSTSTIKVNCLLFQTYSILGSVVSWASIKETASHKRSHGLIVSKHEPPPKRTKTGSDEENVISSTLVEGETSNDKDITNNLQHVSESNVTGTDVKLMDFSPIITKLKCLCNGTTPFDNKQAIILWEELTSVDVDQVHIITTTVLSSRA